MAKTTIDLFVRTLGGDTANGGGGNGGGGNGLMSKVFSKGNKDVKNELEKGNKGDKKSLGATLGIKFGMASLLKQSQVFTGFIGTIFQLMGALVDVILAPFLPILIPGIRLIADMVPYVAKYAQAIYDFIDRTLFQWFRNLGWFDGVSEAAKKALSAILVGVVFLKLTGMWKPFWAALRIFIGKPLWALATKLFPNLKNIVGEEGLKSAIRAGGKSVIRAAWAATGGRVISAIRTAYNSVIRAVWNDGLRPVITAIKRKAMTFLDDLILRIWINGFRATFITPFFSKIRGIAGFLARPFSSLWGSIAGDVAKTGDNFLVSAFRLFRALPFVKTIIDLPGILHRFWNEFPTLIGKLPIVGRILEFITKKIGGFLSGALKLAKGGIGKAAGLADPGRALLGKAPGSGMVSSIASKLSPSALKKIGQGFKAIPILGAVAELGFGGWQTYKDYKKYGAKAAMGRAALTLANTTAALFDPTGLASAGASIASNITMDQMYKRMLDPKDSYKRDRPDLWIEVVNPDGVSTFTKNEQQSNNDKVNASAGMPKDRTSLDGMMY